jgi:DNA-binding MarR family transcriptional regulator
VSSSNSQQDEYLTDAEFRAWHGCLQFTNTVLRALDEALMAAHRISIKEFDVLITVFNAPGGRLRMTELAERVLLTPSGVTHRVTRLERDRLVSRSVDAADRRSYFATLTRAGHRRLREARRTHNEVVRAHLTRRLTASQLATLGTLWEALRTGEVSGTR